MKFYVERQRMKLLDPELIPIVSGSRNIYTAEFEFAPDWDGFTKVAVFRTLTEISSPAVLTSDSVAIPADVIADNGYFVVGVYGSRDGQSMPTVWSHTIRVEQGCRSVLDTVVGDTSLIDQLLAYANNAETAAKAAQLAADEAEGTAAAIQAALDAGEYTPTIEVGTVTTGAAGSNAQVTNSGTPTDVVLDFKIPRGNRGKSAYEYAVEGGYTGTEAQFKQSMAAAAMTTPMSDAEIRAIVNSVWD